MNIQWACLFIPHVLKCRFSLRLEEFSTLHRQFSQHSKNGEVYHTYCLNYTNALNYLEQLRKNDDFCEYEKVSASSVHQTNLKADTSSTWRRNDQNLKRNTWIVSVLNARELSNAGSVSQISGWEARSLPTVKIARKKKPSFSTEELASVKFIVTGRVCLNDPFLSPWATDTV